MSYGFALSKGFLPLLVDPWQELNNATPSVRLHYRALSPNTGCSAPVLPLRYSHPYGDLPFGFLPSHRGTGSHVPCKSPAQLHAAFMPDVVRAAIRPSPGLVPGQRLLPGFDIVYTLSTPHQRFARARLSEPYLTGSSPAFSATLTTPAFDRRSLRWFEACP